MKQHKQDLVIKYLSQGYYIRVLHDHTEQKIYREVTDGENDIMNVHQSTVDALLKKGLIEEKGSYSPSIHIDIQKYRWKAA